MKFFQNKQSMDEESQSQTNAPDKGINKSDPTIPRIRRVNIAEDLKASKEKLRQQSLAFYLLQSRLYLLNFYQEKLNVQHMANQFSLFLKLYHESLQALVQGYREVTMDAKNQFKFEKDGQTVEEKLKKYERKLGEYTSGVVESLREE